MKRFISRYIPLLPLGVLLGIGLFSRSCANTTQAPTGGVKDTIPPVVRKVSPEQGTTNVPVKGTKLVFTFDEYVTVKDPKSIYLSPPQAKSPKYKLKGKSLVVYFEEDLLENTTYTLDLTGALADNNEGNMFPGYTLVFSTGDTVDSMFVTGTVRDCNTLKPLKGATVMLYKDHADSAVFLHRPFAAVKTDDWGFFALRNIKDTLYRVYAVVDAGGNNVYDPDEDRIAFLSEPLRPVRYVADTLPELQKYDMKDTANCLARQSDIDLNVFREKPSKQLLVNKARTPERGCYVTFQAPDAVIDSLWFKGFPASKVITEFNILKDSLLLWVNDRRKMPDSLHLFVKYRKTDSLGVLQPVTEDYALVQEGKSKATPGKRPKLQHQDTVCQLTLKAAPETVEQNGIELMFMDPPVLASFDSLRLISVNPKQKEQEERFRIDRDPLNLRRYVITPQVTYMEGYEYKFKVPHRIFMDINGFWNDSTEVKFSLPKGEEMSSLQLNMTGVSNKYLVDLLDERRNEVLRQYVIEADAQLVFPYLKKGKYSVRITEDLNRNGIVDTGILLAHKQPEKVLFLELNGKDLFDIPEKADIVQDVDVAGMFSDEKK